MLDKTTNVLCWAVYCKIVRCTKVTSFIYCLDISPEPAVSGLLPLLLDPRGRVRPVAGGEVVVVEHVVPQNIVLLLQLVHLLLHTVLQGVTVTALTLSTVCTPGAGPAPCHSGTRRWVARACGWRGRWPSWRRRTRRPSSWLWGE